MLMSSVGRPDVPPPDTMWRRALLTSTRRAAAQCMEPSSSGLARATGSSFAAAVTRPASRAALCPAAGHAYQWRQSFASAAAAGGGGPASLEAVLKAELAHEVENYDTPEARALGCPALWAPGEARGRARGRRGAVPATSVLTHTHLLAPPPATHLTHTTPAGEAGPAGAVRPARGARGARAGALCPCSGASSRRLQQLLCPCALRLLRISLAPAPA